jgi:norsolorinic acid ketoreductase
MRILDLQNHFEINTIGPVRMFQASLPLLKKAQDPKFIVISSVIGTIGGLDQIPFPNAAYGASKAASNYLTRKIHFENKDIVAFAIHPGYVSYVGDSTAALLTHIFVVP